MAVHGVQLTIDSIQRKFKDIVKSEKEKTMNKLVDKLEEVTPVDTGEARAGWYRTENTIENDVAHVKHLNEGSSSQAPAHFIEKTVLAHEGISPSGIIVRDK